MYQLIGANGGEGFSRFLFARGDLVVGDRFYAKPPSLQHVLRSGADFPVRVDWNSMRMVTADGARLDLASIYARMAAEETSEVPVFVAGRNEGRGRKPRRLFPARLIIFRQREEASPRAVRVAERQHSKKRSVMELQPMTLVSARFLMVLTSLPADKAAAAEALAAYRLRWQVELAFKRLKSGLGIGPAYGARPRHGAKLAPLTPDPGSAYRGRRERSPQALPPVRSAGHVHLVSLWRLHAALRFALLGAVLSSLAAAGLQQAGSSIIRHICDSPRRRTCQAVPARSRAPLAPLPSRP